MEWITFAICVALFSVSCIGEVLWLVRNDWASTGKAAAYVITSDLLGIGLGFVVILVVLMITLLLVFGPAGTGSSAPESAYWAVLITAAIAPFMLILLSKRLFIRILAIKTKGNAWAIR